MTRVPVRWRISSPRHRRSGSTSSCGCCRRSSPWQSSCMIWKASDTSDIANVTGVPLGTVMSRIYRGRKLLAALILMNESLSDLAPSRRGIYSSAAREARMSDPVERRACPPTRAPGALLGAYADDELPPEDPPRGGRPSGRVYSVRPGASGADRAVAQTARGEERPGAIGRVESPQRITWPPRAGVRRSNRRRPCHIGAGNRSSAPAPVRDLERLADRGEPCRHVGAGLRAAGRAGHGGHVHGSPGPGLGRQRPREPSRMRRCTTSAGSPRRRCRKGPSWPPSSRRSRSRSRPSRLRTCG